MKLQTASKKEVRRIAIGSSICAVTMVIGLWILSLLGIGTFGFHVLIGAVGGTTVAVFNFALMCLMVQNAAGTEDKKLLKAKVQSSYNIRLFLQAAWIAVSFFVPWIHVLAAAIPLVFPTAVIFILQITGKLVPPSSDTTVSAPKAEPAEEETDGDLGPFEV